MKIPRAGASNSSAFLFFPAIGLASALDAEEKKLQNTVN